MIADPNPRLTSPSARGGADRQEKGIAQRKAASHERSSISSPAAAPRPALQAPPPKRFGIFLPGGDKAHTLFPVGNLCHSSALLRWSQSSFPPSRLCDSALRSHPAAQHLFVPPLRRTGQAVELGVDAPRYSFSHTGPPRARGRAIAIVINGTTRCVRISAPNPFRRLYFTGGTEEHPLTSTREKHSVCWGRCWPETLHWRLRAVSPPSPAVLTAPAASPRCSDPQQWDHRRPTPSTELFLLGSCSKPPLLHIWKHGCTPCPPAAVCWGHSTDPSLLTVDPHTESFS